MAYLIANIPPVECFVRKWFCENQDRWSAAKATRFDYTDDSQDNRIDK